MLFSRKTEKVNARGLVFALMLAGVLPLASPPAARADSEDDAVRFRWAFVAMVGTGDRAVLEPIKNDRVLRTGDQFKMMLEPEQDCFLYVIYHNAQDGMKLLFPYTLDQFETNYERGRRYYIPMGDAWFELDQHVGRETFHLLASADRLTTLEQYFVDYETADAVTRSDLIRMISHEIQVLRKKHRELAAPAERPVAIGGAVRGIEARPANEPLDIAAFSEEISSGSGVVVRTYNIDHR